MKINREPLWMTKTNRVLAIAAVTGGITIGLHLLFGRPAKAIEPVVGSGQCIVIKGKLSCY